MTTRTVSEGQSITNAVNASSPGDTVVVQAGRYNEEVRIAVAGNAGAYITIHFDAGAVLDGAGTLERGIYCDPNANPSNTSGNYFRIEGGDIKRYISRGIEVESGGGNGFQIINSQIHDIGNGSGGDARFGKGIQLRYASGLLVQGTEIWNTGYNAITIVGVRDVKLLNNVLRDGQNDGIAGDCYGTLLIEGNSITNFSNVTEHGDGLQILGFPDSLVIRNNTVSDSTQLIFIEPYSNPTGISPAGECLIEGNNCFFSDPTKWGALNGIIVDQRYNTMKSVTVKNNIAKGMNKGSGAFRNFTWAAGDAGNKGIVYKIGSLTLSGNDFTGSNVNLDTSLVGSTAPPPPPVPVPPPTPTPTPGGPKAPLIDPPGSNFSVFSKVTISAEAGTTIYYTLDNTAATEASKKYTGSLRVSHDCWVRAVAVKGGVASVETRAFFNRR